MTLETEIEIKNDTPVLYLKGDLDSQGCETFGQELVPLAENKDHKNIILDFTGVTYIVSSGLRVVLQAVKAMKPRGAVLHVTGMNKLAASVFSTMGFFTFVTRGESVDECLDKIGGGK